MVTLIADLCNNFNNNTDFAKKLALAAKESGADIAKFQMRLQPDRISPQDHAMLKAYCEDIGIEYLCTAFDLKGLQIIKDMGCEKIKIPSGQALNVKLIIEAIDNFETVFVSTGMLSEEEFTGVLLDFLGDVTFFQCTSCYPCPPEYVNLRWGKNPFDSHCEGLSDHTDSIYSAVGAVALGYKYIEKHFTFDRALEGPDHRASITPEEFSELRMAVDIVEKALGNIKEIFPCEKEKLKYRYENLRTNS